MVKYKGRENHIKQLKYREIAQKREGTYE